MDLDEMLDDALASPPASPTRTSNDNNNNTGSTSTNTPSTTTKVSESNNNTNNVKEHVFNNNNKTPSPSKTKSTNKTSSIRKSSTKKATALRSSDPRLPRVKTSSTYSSPSSTSSSSVFDRLYRTPTVSSARHHTATTTTTTTSVRKKSHAGQTKLNDSDLQVFARLHVSDTAAWSSRRRRTASKASLSSSPRRRPHHGHGFVQGVPSAVTPSPRKVATSSNSSPTTIYSPHMKPRTKLYCRSKYHHLGLEEVQPISLGLSFFQSFCDYETGNLPPKDAAREVIHALFQKDFPVERHWDLHDPTAKERPDHNNWYNVQMTADYYNGQQQPQRAVGRGIVKFDQPGKVVVDNYVYKVTNVVAMPLSTASKQGMAAPNKNKHEPPTTAMKT